MKNCNILLNERLHIVLLIQLALAFFSPPIPLGARVVFPSDLWSFVWITYFGYKTGRYRLATAIFALFFVIYIHGSTRPTLAPRFAQYIAMAEDDLFSVMKEGVMAARFAFWVFGGFVVANYRLDLRRLQRGLEICASTAAVSMICAWFSPAAKTFLGEVYRYNPDAHPWADRIYGVFRSPIEASVALSFSLLILLGGIRKNFYYARAISIFFILIGIFLSKTLTAFAAIWISIFIGFSLTFPMRKRIGVLIVGSGVLTTIAIAAWKAPFLEPKRINFLFRLQPWKIYWNTSLERIDSFLLGYGFHPHFSDNTYIFLFSRGGLLLLLSILVGFGIWWKRNWQKLGPSQNAVPLFFLISGITVDSLILRPVAMILISVGIPFLCARLNGADSANR